MIRFLTILLLACTMCGCITFGKKKKNTDDSNRPIGALSRDRGGSEDQELSRDRIGADGPGSAYNSNDL